MSLTREQFYNKAIRPNLARFSTMVKAREIILYLPCLTFTDKEEIEAKRETSGNFIAIQTLLDNLRRRENWPDEFITALRNCEQRELADEMSAIYDNIRGITNVPRPTPTPAPSVTSTSATPNVTTATIHNVPPTTPPLLSQPAGDAPAHPTPPSNTKSPVLQVPETQQVQQVPPSVPSPSPKPVSQTKIPQLVAAPSQVPLPAVASASEVSLPVQQEVPTNTRAAENKTPVLDTLDGLTTTTPSSTGETFPFTASSQASASNTSQVQITKPCTTTTQISQSLKKTQVPVTVKDVHSEKLSVQDTNSQLRKERSFQSPEQISDPTANELVQRNNTVELPVFNGQTNLTRTAQATSSVPTEVENSPSSIRQEYFSKPGILQHPEPQQNRAGIPPIIQDEPCSTVSDDLEISGASTEQSASPAEQTSSPTASCDSASPNQPEEDHYESVCESQTLVNVINFDEGPPVVNLNGQPPSMLQSRRVISEEQPNQNHVGRENAVLLREPRGHVSDVSDHKKSASINAREQEYNAATPTAVLQPEQREENRPELFRINNIHLIAGAGIALSAVLLAWKLRH